MRIVPFILFATVMAFFGCATAPVKTMAEIRNHRKGTKEVLVGDWQELARYWDMHAQKLSIDFTPSSRLMLFQDIAAAEIVIEGPFGIYGLIELRRLDTFHTEMSCYVTGGIDHTIDDWANLLRSAQTRKSNESTAPADAKKLPYSERL